MLYYRNEDLNQTGNIETTALYSDEIFTNIIGYAIYNVTLFENELLNINIDIEYSNFILDINEKETSSIFFNIALNNNSKYGRLNDGFYEFDILGGSGKYFNATGKVYIYVDERKVRNVKLVINH